MINVLVYHPAGLGTAKLCIHPPSLDLEKNHMLVMAELRNTQEMVIDRQQVSVDGDELKAYLQGEVTSQTLINVVAKHLGYKLLED